MKNAPAASAESGERSSQGIIPGGRLNSWTTAALPSARHRYGGCRPRLPLRRCRIPLAFHAAYAPGG